ncbi:ring finger [Pyrenophora seminiperda CCB06]|uniref:Ring finger n=1 Tax=Pyrenophora seminiperda CCB06 TaxID=1302712 RepID=A0A3M7M3C0_9PLEO|nr:ring finger [Pyrenophora seminiperda CCB06]
MLGACIKLANSMARPAINVEHEIVNLISDSESEDDGIPRDEPDFFAAPSDVDSADEYSELEEPLRNLHAQLHEDDYEMIDLTGVPDIDVPPSVPIAVNDDELPPPNAQAPGWNDVNTPITEAACLQMVLSILPDISADYVLQLIQEKMTDTTRTMVQCEHFLAEILEGEPYPKELNDAKNKKRKRDDEDDDDWIGYEMAERDPEIGGYEHDATELLKDEFPFVPVRHLKIVLGEQNTLFKAYGVLEKQVRDYGSVANSFRRNGKSRIKCGVQLQLINQGSQLPKELDAAKKKSELEAAKRRKAQEAEQAEAANLYQARMMNHMGECACCFDDVPLNRMISCNGDEVHLYCMECPRRQIETQLGESRCRPKCFAVEDCNGTFSRRQLQEILGERTFERLEHLQQREDLAAAGLDFLSECPFCDFKMECPPVEVDKEFRCQNLKCGKTSCRLCQKESHIPLNCEESNKDGKITLRHRVEEAMSAALIRKCNKCKHPFIKEIGCNKMSCTHYRVKQAEDARKGKAMAEAQRFPYHMVGDELRRFNLPPIQPQPGPFDAQPRAANILWNRPFRNPLEWDMFGAGPANRPAQQAHHPEPQRPHQAIPRPHDVLDDLGLADALGGEAQDMHQLLENRLRLMQQRLDDQLAARQARQPAQAAQVRPPAAEAEAEAQMAFMQAQLANRLRRLPHAAMARRR